MTKKPPRNPGERWLIFSGLPVATCAVFYAISESNHRLEHIVGQKLFPYAVLGGPALLIIVGMIYYEHFPSRLVIPLGILGWLVTASILCWFFWFGPGALKFDR